MKSPCPMTASLFRQLRLVNEPPGRAEFSIALITFVVISTGVLASQVVNHILDTETKSNAPTFTRLHTYDV